MVALDPVPSARCGAAAFACLLFTERMVGTIDCDKIEIWWLGGPRRVIARLWSRASKLRKRREMVQCIDSEPEGRSLFVMKSNDCSAGRSANRNLILDCLFNGNFLAGFFSELSCVSIRSSVAPAGMPVIVTSVCDASLENALRLCQTHAVLPLPCRTARPD